MLHHIGMLIMSICFFFVTLACMSVTITSPTLIMIMCCMISVCMCFACAVHGVMGIMNHGAHEEDML